MPLGLIDKLKPSDKENLVDYILWVGDMDFVQYPFRDADALVLCMLSYFDMKMLFEDGREEVLLKKLLPHVEYRSSLPQLTGPDGGSSDIAKAACRSKRFGELTVRNHADVLQTDPPLQFAAMTFHDGKGMDFLAYRGTDSSLAGWKEDCMIAFTETDAQHMAADYAHRVLPTADRWILGGHSKGANQVIYAAAQLSDDELAKVRRIYMLDGPGFCTEIIDEARMTRIEPLITAVIPEFDMIGQLFEPVITDLRVIRSANPEGLGQHALASWLVDHGNLSSGKLSERADRMMRVVNEWIADMSMEERKTFVNELFDAFGTGGTQNLSEITAERFAAVLVELNRSSKVTKKIFADLPKKLINDLFKDVKPLPDLLKDVRAPLPDLAELFKGGKKAEKDENGKDEKA